MNAMQLDEIRAVAIDAALKAGSHLRALLHGDKGVRHKGAVDLVTRADTEAERIVINRIRASFPDHLILAEEQAEQPMEEGAPARWIVDPLDGTTNFVHSVPHFAVSIAFEQHGQLEVGVIYDPCRDELFEAARGRGAQLNGRPIQVSGVAAMNDALMATGFPYDRQQRAEVYLEYVNAYLRTTQGIRRFGAASLDLAYVACGRLDGYWEFMLKPWDVAAGIVILEEAGGVAVGRDGQRARLTGREIVATGPALLPPILEVYRGLPDPLAG